jgi:hypothetical protein
VHRESQRRWYSVNGSFHREQPTRRVSLRSSRQRVAETGERDVEGSDPARRTIQTDGRHLPLHHQELVLRGTGYRGCTAPQGAASGRTCGASARRRAYRRVPTSCEPGAATMGVRETVSRGSRRFSCSRASDHEQIRILDSLAPNRRDVTRPARDGERRVARSLHTRPPIDVWVHPRRR